MRFGGFGVCVLPGIHITSITNRKIEVDEIERRIQVVAEQLPEVAHAMSAGEDLVGKRTLLPEVAFTKALMPGLRFVGLQTHLHADIVPKVAYIVPMSVDNPVFTVKITHPLCIAPC